MAAQRTLAIALGALALGLSVYGVVTAATDPNPAGCPVRDPLALNGYPPKTVGLSLALSSNGLNVNGSLALNLLNDQGQGSLSVPTALNTSSFALRLVANHFFVNSPNFNTATHATWFTVPVHLPDLFGASLELTQPDISLISGFPITSVQHNGYHTTYKFTKDNVALSPIVAGFSSSTGRTKVQAGVSNAVGTETIAITTGAQGEVTGAAVSLVTSSGTTSIRATVEWYNRSVSVVAPPTTTWTHIPTALIQAVLASKILNGIELPSSLASLGSAGSVL